jgi:HEAT repeat protein
VHASAIPALLPKLTDSDYPTRMVAIEVLRNYRRFEGFDAVGASLRAALRDTRCAADVRRAAAHALGELRDAESIEVLAASLAEGDASLATAAHRALVVITRQDFGTAPAPWLAWWVSAAPRHRIEWLIDALLHAEPTIRHEASEELKRLTGQYFGYYFNLPRHERERGHERYVAWWKSDGAQRFGAASGGA